MRLINKPMKRLSLYLFLILFTLQTPSLADDIRDFQIEGMSVGDSLLDYISKSQIQKKEKNAFLYKDKKFIIIWSPSNLKVYEKSSIVYKYKPRDKKYIVHGIDGKIVFPNDIKGCKEKMKEIKSELDTVFKDAKKKTKDGKKHGYDKSGKSKTYGTAYFLNSGGYVDLYCTDWSKKLTKKNKWQDQLTVLIGSQEYLEYLNLAYK